MNRDESRNELGVLRIHKNVISSISSIAAIEIEGVKRVGKDFKSGLAELLGKKFSSAIKVEISKNEEVKVEIPLVIKYGYNIPEIANRVQENVRLALEKMSNLSIKEVNVSVQGIERG
ncbi:MAG TPA: Asp23/Gls24 family envelope stress response protein [Candidatus Omnitrophota bacterium]|nr:Asp23/Gls24 family envelope stress response protein [Candidatus Omnitrophota bacterium]HPT39325.1 Asp23/Gls24 family envelope stress response protein [Candidatus Omnitrophota bacterium]